MNAGGRFELRSAQFRRERQASWQELESLLKRIEDSGLAVLSHDELTQLPLLYRSAIGSLSVARAISLDRNLVQYLTGLAQRAHLAMYSGRRRPVEGVVQFFARRFPQLLRSFRVPFAIAFGSLLAGVLIGYQLTRHSPDRYYGFVPEALAQDRTPSTPTAQLRAILYSKPRQGVALDVFASFLFDHNARIGISCLALGFAGGVPVILLLFSNGLTLGAMAALYASRGLGGEFWAWILPHGVTELLAVVLCGTAGLVFGAAILFPGSLSRLDRLRTRGRDAGLLVLGAVPMFFFAALFESFFRSLSQEPSLRWTVAALVATGWVLYFASGREAARG